ncbi:hypothetical protein Tco_1143193 [Tanacetum coccineum]
MSKLFYTRFTKLMIAYFLSCNKNIPRRSNSEMHSEGDDLPIIRLSNTVDSKFKFRMEIPATMIDDAFKKTTRYKYYKAKKMESEKEKSVEEPEEQNLSPVRSERGKDYMRSGENEANVPKLFKKNVVPRKTRPLTVAKETVAAELVKSVSIKEPRTQHPRSSQLRINSQINEDVANTYAKWGQKLKGPVVDDPTVQSLLDLQKGSKAGRLKSLKQKKQLVTGEGLNTSEESANETDDAKESHMDLPDDNQIKDDDVAGNVSRRGRSSHIIFTSKYNLLFYQNSTTKLTPSQSKEVDAKGEKQYEEDQLQKVVAQKFKDYDQKLEALTNFNVYEAFEKAVQGRVPTKIKRLIPTHILKAIANYVRPRLNTFVLEVMQNNQISLFTKSSTSVDDLSDMDLKLKLLNRNYENKTRPTNQKLYDTLYDSILLDQ